jgi:hypothetical protein
LDEQKVEWKAEVKDGLSVDASDYVLGILKVVLKVALMVMRTAAYLAVKLAA